MNKKKITIRDIAKESGVSVATVSRYINKVSYTSPKTQRKIQKVLEQFDYTPNAIARGLATQKSYTIAFVTPDISNPFFPELVKSIELIAKSKGYHLLLINTSEQDLTELKFWGNLKSKYVDGIILAESKLHFDIDVEKHLRDLNIPFVRIDRAAQVNRHSSVSINNFSGATLAVNHLIEIGCKQIAHISGPESIAPSLNRLNGYLHAIKTTKQSPIVYKGDFTLEGGANKTKKLLKENPNVDGIFYANDLMAIGSLKVLKKKEISIPEDIAIIGFDDIKLSKIVSPEVSTIKQPINEIGEIAAKTLIHEIDNSTEVDYNNVVLDVKLVIRESSQRNN